MDSDDVISTLNDLIETCKDGEYGFRECAKHVRSPELKSVFEQRANDCAEGARELQAQVQQLGGSPDKGGSASGALHRGWVAVKGALGGSSDLSMLEECERGEDAAMDRYREALAKELPGDVRSIVERQYDGVKRNHNQIRTLRNNARAAE